PGREAHLPARRDARRRGATRRREEREKNGYRYENATEHAHRVRLSRSQNRPIGPAPKRSEIARDLVALPGRRRKSRLAALSKRLELFRVADEREPRTWRLDRQTVERIEAMVSIANGDVHTARMHF